MPLISITPESGNTDDLFKQPEYPVLPAGKHLFAVRNKIEITTKPETGNDVIKAEFVCQDEDENKGIVVFENFVFIAAENLKSDNHKKSLEINQARFSQFTVSCGVATESQVRAGEQFDLDDFEGKLFSASSVVKMESTQEVDENGKPIKALKASIKKFLFEPEKTAEPTA